MPVGAENRFKLRLPVDPVEGFLFLGPHTQANLSSSGDDSRCFIMSDMNQIIRNFGERVLSSTSKSSMLVQRFKTSWNSVTLSSK